MRLHWLAAVFVFAASAACAGGYDDFALALSARASGDNDAAILEFTKALAASDLNPRFVPTAYLDRGYAYMHKHDCAKAVDDFTAALKLTPGFSDALWSRFSAYKCLGDDSRAETDIDALIALRPGYSEYLQRGQFRWATGDYTGAASDLEQAIPLSHGPFTSYVVLWLEMARLHAGKLQVADVRHDTEPLSSGWPAPVFDLYAGKTTADEILADAAAGDSDQRANRECEANFYVGDWLLVYGKTERASSLLQSAVASCPHDFVEYDGAKVDLKRIKN